MMDGSGFGAGLESGASSPPPDVATSKDDEQDDPPAPLPIAIHSALEAAFGGGRTGRRARFGGFMSSGSRDHSGSGL